MENRENMIDNLTIHLVGMGDPHRPFLNISLYLPFFVKKKRIPAVHTRSITKRTSRPSNTRKISNSSSVPKDCPTISSASWTSGATLDASSSGDKSVTNSNSTSHLCVILIMSTSYYIGLTRGIYVRCFNGSTPILSKCVFELPSTLDHGTYSRVISQYSGGCVVNIMLAVALIT